MWVLRTDRAELHHFPSPEAVPGGYAILSHAWGDHEQTFQETQAFERQGKETGQNPRDLASEKVRECCILAERHGYRWLWDDTCCIDKTSSTELSEAINSMFVWYSCAEMCFAYLADVESDCDLHAKGSAFRTARWHSRGWTLQELIASLFVIFVARDWKTIGTKRELAPLLEEVTRVPRQVLTRETHFSAVSIASRMSWASERSTTRVEDEAYCLMGLFSVNMPTLYGEGRQAFYRLQHEIMKQSFDTSLFAWGAWVSDPDLVTPLGLSEIYMDFDNVMDRTFFLLAPSPKHFRKPFGQSVRYTPSANNPVQLYLDWQWKANADGLAPEDINRRQLSPFGQRELPSFSITHHGVKCRFPIIESDGLTIAVLLCDDGSDHIGLLLFPSNDPVQDPSQRKYYAGHAFNNHLSSDQSWYRLVFLGNDLYNFRLPIYAKTVTAEWRDIFILDSPPPVKEDAAPSLCIPLHSIEPAPPFRVPHWIISRLTKLGLELRSPHMPSWPSGAGGKPLLVEAIFTDVVSVESIHIFLGTCTQSPGQHWAKVFVSWRDLDRGKDSDLDSGGSHDCRRHHVMAWPNWTQDFGDIEERTVRLSFTRCKLTPERTLVLHLELGGRVYDAMKKRANVELPSREALGLGAHAVGGPCDLLLPMPTQPPSPRSPPSASVSTSTSSASERLGTTSKLRTLLRGVWPRLTSFVRARVVTARPHLRPHVQENESMTIVP